jgi:hypothetical protein
MDAALGRPAFLAVFIAHGLGPAGFDIDQDLLAEKETQAKCEIVAGIIDPLAPGRLDILVTQVGCTPRMLLSHYLLAV